MLNHWINGSISLLPSTGNTVGNVDLSSILPFLQILLGPRIRIQWRSIGFCREFGSIKHSRTGKNKCDLVLKEIKMKKSFNLVKKNHRKKYLPYLYRKVWLFFFGLAKIRIMFPDSDFCSSKSCMVDMYLFSTNRSRCFYIFNIYIVMFRLSSKIMMKVNKNNKTRHMEDPYNASL